MLAPATLLLLLPLLAPPAPRLLSQSSLHLSPQSSTAHTCPYPLPTGALQRVVYSLEPPGLLRSLKAAYYSAASAAERLRWGPTRSQSFWDHMLALSWGRPLLYLYSSDDPLAHGARINELVAEKQRRGQAVRARCWDSSEHVGHLRRHRGEYTRLLLGFLADCEASIGSRQEPPRGGNGSGHDDSGSRGSRGGDRAAEVGSGSSGSSGRVAEVLPRARL